MEDQPAGASAASQAALKGRAAIFRSRTSDSEDEPCAIVKARRVSTTRASKKGWATISVRNMTITCYAGKGRQLLVPVDTGDMNRIIQHLIPRADEEARGNDSDTYNFSNLLKESDGKKIGWRKASVLSPGCGWWVVYFMNKDGKPVTYRSGLLAPRKNLAGEKMDPEDQKAAAEQVLLRARKQWDRLDFSDRARFKDVVS